MGTFAGRVCVLFFSLALYLPKGAIAAEDVTLSSLGDFRCSIKADRICWNGKQCALENLDAESSLAKVRAERATLEVGAEATGNFQLHLFGGIRATGPTPTALDQFPPTHWELLVSRAKCVIDREFHFQSVQLSAIELSAFAESGLNAAWDEMHSMKSNGNETIEATTKAPWGQITAEEGQVHWPMRGNVQNCRFSIERLTPSFTANTLWDLLALEGSCPQIQFTETSVRALPDIDLQWSGGSLRHSGAIEATWQQRSRRAKLDSINESSGGALVARGWGTTQAQLHDPLSKWKAKLVIPGRFYLDAAQSTLDLWARDDQTLSMTWDDVARQVTLRGKRAFVSIGSRAIDSRRATISKDVALSCIERGGKIVSNHRVLADELTLSNRSLAFTAHRGHLVRYVNDQTDLIIEAQALSAGFPKNQPFRVWGSGVVRARMRATSSRLSSPKNPFTLK